MYTMKSDTPPKELYKIYLNCFTLIFEKIKGYLSKKNPFYNEIMTFIKTYKDHLNEDKNQPLNGDKYFPIIAKSMEIENVKITDTVLTNLKILIENNLLLGKSKDNPIITPKDSNKNRKMIDSIVETLSKLDYIKDESIWISIAEVLNELVINNEIYLNSKPIENIYKFYIRVYLKCKNEHNSILIKSKNDLLVEILYERMMKCNGGSMNTFFPIDRKNSLSSRTSNTIDMNNSLMYSTYINLKSLNKITVPPLPLDKNPLDVLICRETKEMIDTICFCDGKRGPITTIIPKTESELMLPKFRHLSNPRIKNECGHESGFFGWCYICRRKADYYCKDTRKPICSYKCKELLEKEEEKLNKYIKGDLIPEDVLGNLLYIDCITLFKYFCGLISLDTSNRKTKLISFSILTKILESYGEKYLSNKRDFIQLIQDDLTEGLFKNCVSEDTEIFKASVNLIFIVWKIYREHLKVQISIFNETVFLKILDSENSSYIQKKIVLEYFSKQDLIYFIELYANYDCVINEKFLVSRIATALNKIAQGKYIKTDQSFSDEENYELRNLALSTLSNLISSVFNFCDQCPKYKNLDSFINEPSISSNQLDDTTPLGDDTIVSRNDTLIGKETLDQNLKKKFQIQAAVDKFNIKIKTGINYLKRIKYIDDSNPDLEARDIMNFLRNTPGLKKEFIGEYLGDNSEMSLKVLKLFAQSFDFEGLHIVQALRKYLSTFQLPGEGQKIDRIVENFASKYHNDNPDLYATADTAYYLAFAIIILQTDLHNPNVKDKMTFESFCKILDGQNGNQNLSPNYLRDIFDQINANPISLPELDEEKDKLDSRKEDKYKRERTRIINECSEKLKQTKDSMYNKVYDIEEYISPFMENIWTPILAMYSVLLEESEDYNLYSKCISGMSNCIKICGLLGLDKVQKTAIITSLLTMTNLFQTKPITKKNILCIKEILLLANGDPRYCNIVWNLIFDLVDKIYFYLLFVTGSKSEKEEILNKMTSRLKKIPNYEEQIEIEKENMKTIAKEIQSNDYEKIFVKSIKLGRDSITNFITSLCTLAKKQFKEDNITKIFWMQKIVEVSELNLYRVKIEWSGIWPIIRDFLIDIGLSLDINNSITAVDSLRQLAMKYLQMKETSDFHFQKEFFVPFQAIWDNSKSLQTKDYVISCINNLVLNEANSIKSGWIIIFNIYGTVTNIDNINEDIIQRTLNTIYEISQKNFADISDVFIDFCTCLKTFCKVSPQKVLSILDFFVQKLTKIEHFKVMLQCYYPIILEQDENIVQVSLSKMHSLIKQGLVNPTTRYIQKDKEYWTFLLNDIIIPLIRELTKNVFQKPLQELLINTAGLFNDYFSYNYNLLEKYFDAVSNVICSGSEICNSGLECLKYIVGIERMKNMQFLHCFITLLLNVINRTLPKKLITLNHKEFLNPEKPNSTENLNSFVTDCYILFSVLELIKELIPKSLIVIVDDDINLLLESLENVYTICFKFNSNIELRIAFTKYLQNCMELNQIAVLFKHQRISIEIYFEILITIYGYNSNDARKEFCFKKIMDSSVILLQWFVELNNDLIGDEEQEIEYEKEKIKILENFGDSIINSVFPNIVKISFYKNEKYKDIITKILLELILCNIFDIRTEVKEILTIVFEESKKEKNCK